MTEPERPKKKSTELSDFEGLTEIVRFSLYRAMGHSEKCLEQYISKQKSNLP